MLVCVVYPAEPKIWGFVGLVPVITGILGWCPYIYLLKSIQINKF